jgi:hypothetical protein
LFTIRVAAFIVSLLLLSRAVEPVQGWFIALVVLTGLSILSLGPARPRIYLGSRFRRWVDDRYWG